MYQEKQLITPQSAPIVGAKLKKEESDDQGFSSF